MAKNRKFAEREVPEPTFDKQLDDYGKESTDSTDPIFSGKFYDFMRNLLATRDTAVKEELKECVGEVLKPWYDKFEIIIESLKKQSQDLAYLKDVAKDNTVRIETLENAVDIHNKILDGHNAILKQLKPNRTLEIMIWITLVISIATAGMLIFHLS